MLVLRVETEYGAGPYTSSTLSSICREIGDSNLAYDTGGRHPTPHDDSKYRASCMSFGCWEYEIPPKNHVFGFEDYKQFRAWFYSDEILAKLSNNGFELSVYDTGNSTVLLGNAQLTFEKSSRKVASFPLNISKETLEFNLDALKIPV